MFIFKQFVIIKICFMKTKFSVLMLILSFVFASGFSQEKTKKELKEEKKIEKQKQIEKMVSDTDFVFVARTALPTGMKSVNLTSNPNYVKFKPDLIDSYMPYFGRAYTSVGYGSDTGLKFKGKPDEFKISKTKKAFQINATVSSPADKFSLSLSVGFEGSASLSITSNNRSTISYQGEISAPEKPVE
jgi:hypothetical protein